jgi:hypothetical protein
MVARKDRTTVACCRAHKAKEYGHLFKGRRDTRPETINETY